jgi:hypothetical protein
MLPNQGLKLFFYLKTICGWIEMLSKLPKYLRMVNTLKLRFEASLGPKNHLWLSQGVYMYEVSICFYRNLCTQMIFSLKLPKITILDQF